MVLGRGFLACKQHTYICLGMAWREAPLHPHVSLHNRCVLGPACWLAAPTSFGSPATVMPGALLHRVLKPVFHSCTGVCVGRGTWKDFLMPECIHAVWMPLQTLLDSLLYSPSGSGSLPFAVRWAGAYVPAFDPSHSPFAMCC